MSDNISTNEKQMEAFWMELGAGSGGKIDKQQFLDRFEQDPAYALEGYTAPLFFNAEWDKQMYRLRHYIESHPEALLTQVAEACIREADLIHRGATEYAPWEACSTNPVANVNMQQKAKAQVYFARSLKSAATRLLKNSKEEDHAV